MLESRRTPTALQARFEHFAEETVSSSRLYSYFSRQIAKSAYLLELLSHARPDQPAPNLLFGAVHFLLSKNPSHNLASYYPSLTKTPRPIENSFNIFVEFCNEYESAIKVIFKNKRVQTNEVARSAILMPAIAHASERFKGQGLSIIEVGASAGLNMLWDQFRYLYEDEKGQQLLIGPEDSKLQIRTRLKGEYLPNFPKSFPTIHHRIGIDLNPLAPSNKDDRGWLRALIWPEHSIRRQDLETAFNILAEHPQEIVKGDAVKILPKIALMSPQESPLLILSSLTLYQFSAKQKRTWAEILASLSKKRQVSQISIDLVGKITSALRLQEYHKGDFKEYHLANSNSHSKTLEWLKA